MDLKHFYGIRIAKKVLTSIELARILEMIHTVGNDKQSMLFQYALNETLLRFDEAVIIHEILYPENRDSVRILSVLLPKMVSSTDSRKLLYEVLKLNVAETNRLKLTMGHDLSSSLGILDGTNTIYSFKWKYSLLSCFLIGFYVLDLSKEKSRHCIETLIRYNELFRAVNMTKSCPLDTGFVGDCSQNGDW